MYGLLFKSTVILKPSKAGARLLGALDTSARRLKYDLVVTCGAEGHPPDDPHSRGDAFDVRTHDLREEDKLILLREVMIELSDGDNVLDAPMPASGGLGTLHFWGWIEHPNDVNEHLHVQVRKFTVYE